MKGITADQLNRKQNTYTLDAVVKEEIKCIDAKILSSHDNGLNMIVYDLPTQFMVDDENLRDIQVYIYSELIKSYKERGFTVFIKLEHKPKLICKWINRACASDYEERKRIIKNNEYDG
jgi:hypothetical protein